MSASGVPQLTTLMQEFVRRKSLENFEGCLDTDVPGVHFYRAKGGSERKPLLYQSGVIIMGQGRKNIYLGDHTVSYGPGDYLVLGIPLPLECEAISENDEPILGISIDVKPHVLQHLTSLLQQNAPTCLPECEPECGIRSVAMDKDILDATCRLLNVLFDRVEAAALGEHLVSEIIFRILTGPSGKTLFGLAQHNGQYARIARTLSTLHNDYAHRLTVDDLAEQANMSVSAFHRAFRQVTLASPLQYLKKVRLSKAHDLIAIEGKKANEAAYLVGYTSATQFSREFKRHYSYAPGQAGGF